MRLRPLHAVFAALSIAALAACTPNLDDKLVCVNSDQCPTGYYCAADGKCQTGDTVPEITLITPTTGVTFSGVISLQMSVIDPVGIGSVVVSLAGAGVDAGSPVAATAGQNSVYTVSLDSRALGIASSGSFTATITATNDNGKTSTLAVPLQLDDQGPAITAIAIAPATVTAGQAAVITFSAGESLSVLPVVKLTPPDGSAARYAAYVSVASNAYSFQFIPLPADPVGAYAVQISAQDSFGNVSTSASTDVVNVVAGGAQGVTLTGMRGDGVTDARAFDLNAGATVAVTAAFTAALSGAPTAFLCPVAAPPPCTASSTGSTPFTLAAGSAANTYTFTIPAVVASAGTEGMHALTVSGTSVSGAALSGSVEVTFDFTAPVFIVQSPSLPVDGVGRAMVSMAADPTLTYVAQLTEPLPALPAPSAVVGMTVVPLDTSAASALSPHFVLALDGSLKSAPPVPGTFAGNTVDVTICDAANNCSTVKSAPFVEIDAPAVIGFSYPDSADSPAADGGIAQLNVGDPVSVGVDLDRPLAAPFTGMTVELINSTTGNVIALSPAGTFAGPAATPFGYLYQTTIGAAANGVYKIEVTAGTDGYGNPLPVPAVQSTGPFVTVTVPLPAITNVSFSETVVGVGQSAVATITVDEPLGTDPGASVAGNAGALTAVTVTPSTLSASTPRVFTLTYKMPAACNGTSPNPADGAPFPVYAVINDGVDTTAPIQIGSLTCAATSIAGATASVAAVHLRKAPYSDGTVRSIVYASPSSLTGYTGTGAGISLVATVGATQVGAGPFLPADKSVAAFQLSGGQTQVALKFVDLLGNAKVVTGYPEELDINPVGIAATSSKNPYQVIDVSTGDDTYYAAPYWFDGGPGPAGALAAPVINGDGGSNSFALSLLTNADNLDLSVVSSPVFVVDAGDALGTVTHVGAEQFGNAFYDQSAGTVSTTPAPSARYGSTMIANYNDFPLVLMGGLKSAGVAADPAGVIWSWQPTVGWVQAATTFDGGVPNTVGIGLGYDSNGNLLVFGGSTGGSTGSAGIAALTNRAFDDNNNIIGGVWLDGGTIGVPNGFGQLTSAQGAMIESSANGYGYFGLDAGTFANGANFTAMNTSVSGLENCLLYMASCNGNYTDSCIYSCADQSGLGGTVHQGAALAVAYIQYQGVGYSVISYGGKQGSGTSNNFASSDLLLGHLAVWNGGSSFEWTPLPSTGGPAPRSNAAVYFISNTARIGMFGGIGANGQPLNDSWEYDLATSTWNSIDNPHAGAILPSPRGNFGYASANDNLYIVGGNSGLADNWTIGREARDRVIAKVPVNTQLSSPTTATLAQLNISVAVSVLHPSQDRAGAHPEMTGVYYDFAPVLYLWNGSSWIYLATLESEVASFSIPFSASALPAAAVADGNVYLMVAGPGVGYEGERPSELDIDQLSFSVTFQ